MYPHSIDYLRPTFTKDKEGGQVRTYTTLYSSVSADVQPISQAKAVQFAKENIKTTHHVYVTRDLGFVVGDVIQHGSDQYTTTAAVNMAGRGRIWRFECERLLA